VRARVEANAVCAVCGTPTIVPFVPRQQRPVLCRSCFDSVTAQWIADCGAA
jgi:CxxC-x17-CxxC domain-containing protein